MTSAPRGPLGPLRLMEGVGIELEYMIVDRESLDVCPIADVLLREAAGGNSWVSDYDPPSGAGIGWSNELVNHVIEFKTIEPVPELSDLAGRFQAQVEIANALLAPHGARLLPGGMHPWMDPAAETRLWAHDYNPVYERLDRIFSCRGHGWSNLQSTHINLSFGTDEEFGKLHAAIRLLLPLLPALAASSPVRDGRPTGTADTRLVEYAGNSRRIPSVAGSIIPEPAFDRATYEKVILDAIARDVAPFDKEGILQPAWTNSRGAIARFDRGSIEIRLLDVQECPAADIAIAGLVRGAISALLEERWAPLGTVRAAATGDLARVLAATIAEAERAPVDETSLLRCLGLPGNRYRAGEIWSHLRSHVLSEPGGPGVALAVIEDEGTLATRISRRLEAGAGIREVYEELGDCLGAGRSLSNRPGD